MRIIKPLLLSGFLAFAGAPAYAAPAGLGIAAVVNDEIITTADIFDAITAVRPYRGAIPVDKTLAIMAETVGTAIDARCFEHLKMIVKASPELFPE